jgi:ATP/maltotriose-dependent transcriptional regulator MalT
VPSDRSRTDASVALAEFFVSEVLEQQPSDMAQFMLDISILGELTADSCAAVNDA